MLAALRYMFEGQAPARHAFCRDHGSISSLVSPPGTWGTGRTEVRAGRL